jgi:uncharacterized protein (DUF169 family)
MQSTIAQSMNLKYSPVAILWSDEKPEGALQFAPGRWGCVMGAFAAAAERGRVAVFDKQTYGCWGGGVGLGFGNCYDQFPGGVDCFCGFLSNGNEKSDKGKAVAEACAGWMKGELREDFLHGERYKQTPAHVQGFLDRSPMMQVPTRYVIFKPLAQVQENETVQVVAFLANPDQLSALVVLANYDRPDSDGATIPFAAGCQSIGIFTYRESASAHPRAVIGMVDLSARRTMRKLGQDLMTVSVPWKLFQTMEANVAESFLQKAPWTELASAKA